MMQHLTVERMQAVGNGRHLRLKLRSGQHSINAIFFSATPESAGITLGDLVDVAFMPQINEFRGERTVQMNIVDIHPACLAACSPEIASYRAMRRGTLHKDMVDALLPDRSTLAMVWRYLAGCSASTIQETPMCLCRKIVRWSGLALSLSQLLTCLDIFSDVGLLQLQKLHKYITIRLTPGSEKADLSASKTMQQLLQVKES